MFGLKVRTKAPEQVLTELEHLFELGWRRSVFFVDDNFIGDPVMIFTNRCVTLYTR
jgi:radical SAM superfamily enzyme YgiQ (UPF0313 family)